MIRINLLSDERRAAKAAPQFHAGQAVPLACGLIVALAAAGIGARYWMLRRESARLDDRIAAARQEAARLQSIFQQVQDFDRRKAELQQRVTLIEELRRQQSGPVHMLDQVSRALPPAVWLTELKQNADSVSIEGKAAGFTGVSDFAAALESSGYFDRSVEIVSSQAETLQSPPGELVKFIVKAQVKQPAAQSGPAAAREPAKEKAAR